MSAGILQQRPHRRFNPLLREWVLVSPHRTQRPWQGRIEEAAPRSQPAYDPKCYLCPGNARAGGARNPAYTNTFVFDNDYAALLPDEMDAVEADRSAAGAVDPDGRRPPVDQSGLLRGRLERGVCRVICFSPRHDLTIPRMSQAEVRAVVDFWAEQQRSLGAIPWVRHVQIFENRGELMGASNPHPHCQAWATESLPNEPAKELNSFREYATAHGGTCLLCDYLKLEIEHGERVVCQNDSFVALVPFWAVWPFEVMVQSKRHFGSMWELTAGERDDLAEILRGITTRYDNVFNAPFPYTMGFHQAPTDRPDYPEWHFHAHYLPPLLRSATVRKFMVGFELLGTPQRDITPERAAARLIEVGEVHYLDRAAPTK